MKACDLLSSESRAILLPGKKLLFLATICLLMLSACHQCQYISINCNLSQNDKREFVTENDTVMVKYTFAGQNCPMTVEIYNKLRHSLYIDWRNTAVIIDTIQVRDAFYHDEQISVIAPQSNLVLSGILIQNMFIPTYNDDSIAKVVISTSNGSDEVTRHSYNPETSPLNIRCYLALSTNADASYQFYIDNQFWVSDIIKTMTRPASLTYKPSNEFYVSKTTTYGKIMGVLTYTMVLGLLAAINY
jgi:hypothetical protein